MARPFLIAALAASSGTALDGFDETLHLRPVPFTRDPELYLARFEFSVSAEVTAAFRADQFDIFPKPLGQLLNAHSQLEGFDATLTRGRWKDEWGSAPYEVRPPGATLTAAMTAGSDDDDVKRTWKFLISALSGSLCASFEGMDPDHDSSQWVVPLDVPWAESDRNLRFSSLPYEPVCTENLTPFLKLLPCGRHAGLAAMMPPVAFAESPLFSLSLAGHVSQGRVSLRGSIDVVLNLHEQNVVAGSGGIGTWLLGLDMDEVRVSCPAATSSRVIMHMDKEPDRDALAAVKGAKSERNSGGKGFIVTMDTRDFAEASAEDMSTVNLFRSGMDLTRPSPWETVRVDAQTNQQQEGVSVMRDILSQEGRSERLHGRYLLRFTNEGVARRVRFMDQLPFFVRPLWHKLRAVVRAPNGQEEHLEGLEAMQRLSLKFMPNDGHLSPTEVFLTVDVLAGGSVSVFLDVMKDFIKVRQFSYACEKGFDVSSAAWMEAELPLASNISMASDFVASLATDAQLDGRWRLRFTQGLIVLLPMPDFSMPFNVIALSTTAVTVWFGAIFRLTAAGRMKHWVAVDINAPQRRGIGYYIRMFLLVALLATVYYLSQTEDKNLTELRETLPPQAGIVVDQLVSLKETVDSVMAR